MKNTGQKEEKGRKKILELEAYNAESKINRNILIIQFNEILFLQWKHLIIYVLKNDFKYLVTLR